MDSRFCAEKTFCMETFEFCFNMTTFKLISCEPCSYFVEQSEDFQGALPLFMRLLSTLCTYTHVLIL